MRYRSIAALPLLLTAMLPVHSASAAAPAHAPSDAQIAAALTAASQKYRVPTVILEGLAWHESQWKTVGTTNAETGHVGLLGVPSTGRTDIDKLQSDWQYNIDEGTKALVLAWNRAPRVGITGKLDDWRNVLESWYLAIGRYGRLGKNRTVADAYADSVLTAIASGGAGRWQPVSIMRPRPEQLADGLNILCPPAPWHFGDVAPRPPAKTVVSLDVPYLNQVYDDPAGFNGEGACGPTSMVMLMAFYHKFTPNPTPVAGWYNHPSLYASYLPDVYHKVCQPGVGAVHAKMLDYFRPYFPGVAVFYNEKATFDRVKAELDAGRPCIIGTEVTSAGHIMVVRGYLSDGRLLVCDPAGDREKAARAPSGGPLGDWSKTGVRYWNGDGGHAVYDWEALQVRWVMTVGPADTQTASDIAEDAPKTQSAPVTAGSGR